MDLEFKDLCAPDVLESRIRVSKKLGRDFPELPRYCWRISSESYVTGDDIEEHLEWIFHLLPSDSRLCDLLSGDFDYSISTFWVGNGTGGGVLISVRMAELLSKHRVALGVGFYLDEVVGTD